MILQALTRYYEDMLQRGDIAQPGWNSTKVAYGLLLDDDGHLVQLLHLRQEVEGKGGKKFHVPQVCSLPSPVKRGIAIVSNFLWDNSRYLLGVDDKGNPERSLKCFEAAKALHLNILEDVDSPAAKAVVRFFESWDPEKAEGCPVLQNDWDDMIAGSNLVFWYQGGPVSEDPEIRKAWQCYYDGEDGDESGEQDIVCLVTGRHDSLANLHPSIKGVAGGQATGASLVSFNAPSFCSYGYEQGANAPIGKYAAFAYTTALNTLLADRSHVCQVGDTTILMWAEGADTSYQDWAVSAMFGSMDADAFYRESDLLNALHHLSEGYPIEWNEDRLDPNMRFYVLGLAPNAGRISVQFFWRNSFGRLAQNLKEHYELLQLFRSGYEQRRPLSVWRMVMGTVREPSPGAKRTKPNPRLAGDLLLAILNGTRYPVTLLNGINLRIHATHNVTWEQASIIKAYYLRNSTNEQLKEVMTMELNEQSTYLPYVLGRLFAVLEAVQQTANPGVNTSIRDRYFVSASSMPARVFPILINLAQSHLGKISDGRAVYYDKRITELISRITETLPTQMTQPEQNAFQIGYYHETQMRYAKKEEK